MAEPVTLTVLALKGASLVAGKLATAGGAKVALKVATKTTKMVINSRKSAREAKEKNIAVADADALICCGIVYKEKKRNKGHCSRCHKVLGKSDDR
jgi:hypothetical protein